MNFGGFCGQCKCSSCEEAAKCEILYPSTEDYCLYDCQGREILIPSCNHFKKSNLDLSPKSETLFQDVKRVTNSQIKTKNLYVYLSLKLRRHRE